MVHSWRSLIAQKNCIQATILTGASHSNTVLIPRIKLAPSDTNLPSVLEGHQLPLHLAYSMTISKAQGQTVEKVGFYYPFLSSPMTSSMWLFSRARSLASVKVKIIETQQQGKRNERTVTPNVVYCEVLASSTPSLFCNRDFPKADTESVGQPSYAAAPAFQPASWICVLCFLCCAFCVIMFCLLCDRVSCVCVKLWSDTSMWCLTETEIAKVRSMLCHVIAYILEVMLLH